MAAEKKRASKSGGDLDLYRGDDATAVSVPTPAADTNIVRHILFLDGAGRSTPYTSTTDDRVIAKRFTQPRGRVWETSTALAALHGAGHVSNDELMQNLRGKGHGARFAGRPTEVARARVYAEIHREHLLDWHEAQPGEIEQRVRATFK